MKIIILKKANEQKAQTAMELAIFGSIVIFILGLIIRQGVSTGYMQNFQLKTMRQALLTSCTYSGGCSDHDSASRNTSSVLVVEDRLTAASAKYGSVDRMPLMANASATHSHNLFYPVEEDEFGNLPATDIYVNGQHFQLTTGAFITWCIAQTGAECDSHKASDGLTILPYQRCALNDVGSAAGTGCEGKAQKIPWDPSCATLTIPGTPPTTSPVGCAIVSEIIYNHPGIAAWCDNAADCANVEDRFNLDRDLAGTADVPLEYRSKFIWQWDQRRAINVSINTNVTLGAGKIGMKTGTNSSVDIDGDAKEETLMSIKHYDALGRAVRVRVTDYQEGDINVSIGDGDPEPLAGFGKDVQLYTFVKDRNGSTGGTYALIEEGKLFTANRQVIRTTRRKDSIDVIQRDFQLHNTNRLCPDGPNMPGIGNIEICKAQLDGCFEDDAVYKNCLWMGPSDWDPSTDPVEDFGRKLFIRSRILDLHGRKWVTDIQDDSSVDLEVPAL